MSSLPNSWVEIPLSEDVVYKKGKKPKQLVESLTKGLVPYIDIKAFEKGIIRKYANSDDGVITSIDETLMVWDGARSGLVGRGIDGVIGSTLMRITPIVSKINYLHYFLQSKYGEINSRTKGTGIPHVDPQVLWQFKYPLAPLNEQIRIANKLDSLLVKVDAAKTRLDKIPTILKRFRQSVLAAATSGQLTEEWRNDEIEWAKVRLGEVGTGFNYGSSSKSQNQGKVPVLRMGNIQGGKLDWNKLVYTSNNDEIEKYKLEKGDVLFNRTNSPELVGKTAIYRGEREAIYAGYLIKVKGTERLDSDFLNIQLNSPNARDYCWQVKTDGVSQSNINAKKLQAYEFLLPLINEQKEIVRRVDDLFALADVVEKQYQAAKSRVDKLTQSILAKAFRGELVPQDPDDEPADKLLERISAKWEAQQQIKSKKVIAKPKTKAKTVSKKKKEKIKKRKIDDITSQDSREVLNQWLNNKEIDFYEKASRSLKGQTFSVDQLKSVSDFNGSYDEFKNFIMRLLKGLPDQADAFLEVVDWSEKTGEYQLRIKE